jgi:hypothetical protein
VSKGYSFDDIFGHRMIQNPFDDGLDLAGVQGVPIEAYSRSGLRRTIAKNPAIQIIAEYGPGWLGAAGV